MAQTPAERRAKRDETARKLIDPRTGEFFKSYNALDTYRRNVKAKAAGYTSRSQERYSKTVKLAREEFPDSYQKFLHGRKDSEALAKEFLRAWGRYPKRPTKITKRNAHAARANFLASEESEGWNWQSWREEYSSM